MLIRFGQLSEPHGLALGRDNCFSLTFILSLWAPAAYQLMRRIGTIGSVQETAVKMSVASR